MHRSFIALVAVMVATTAVGAVTALAGQPAAPSFELTFEGWMGQRGGGAEFTASGTFCSSRWTTAKNGQRTRRCGSAWARFAR